MRSSPSRLGLNAIASGVAVDGEDLQPGGAQRLGVPAAAQRRIHGPVRAGSRGEDRPERTGT